MAQRHDDAADRLSLELDVLRALVRSWGTLPEGSVTQATAIRNSNQVIQRLLTAANVVIATNEQENRP
jgi:hypothetical protein